MPRKYVNRTIKKLGGNCSSGGTIRGSRSTTADVPIMPMIEKPHSTPPKTRKLMARPILEPQQADG
jgi:hypothetical protein